MKKIITVFALSVVILVSFGFIVLRMLATNIGNTSFNTKVRPQLSAHPFLRQILALHFDGDGRADYMGDRYEKILIEVDLSVGLTIHTSTLDLLKQRIEEITGKETSYIISDRNVTYLRNATDDQIADLVEKNRNHKNSKDTATVYLLYLAEYASHPTLLGLTYHEYGVLLFDESLQNFTEANPDSLPSYEASTALHEFGHQIGLPHNNIRGCLMNEHAGTGVTFEDPSDVLTDFCNYEKKLIR